ncbi:hypothetical protein ABG768_012503 [Culter alburnus]|uniref:Chemokine interleukin-8-like domain-containing protein n=1 Tax=Culter alburnus TaxID=194366 RepID=A0AAW2B1X9_CULAL
MKSHMLGFHAVLLLWLLVSSSMQDHSPPGTGCLTTTDTKVPVRNLRSYTRQHKPVFPVNAVRFLTVKGITICSDPSSPWAVKAMKYLDEKKKPRRSVTAVPTNTSTINMTRSSAQIETQTTGQK